jgi:hypothetical protein
VSVGLEIYAIGKELSTQNSLLCSCLAQIQLMVGKYFTAQAKHETSPAQPTIESHCRVTAK